MKVTKTTNGCSAFVEHIQIVLFYLTTKLI